MADLAWAPADLPQSKLRHAEQEYYSLNNVQCSKHLTALLKHFYPASLCVWLFLTKSEKPFTLGSLNCEGYQKIDFHQELVFVEGKYLMDIKTVELCSYALQRKTKNLC